MVVGLRFFLYTQSFVVAVVVVVIAVAVVAIVVAFGFTLNTVLLCGAFTMSRAIHSKTGGVGT